MSPRSPPGIDLAAGDTTVGSGPICHFRRTLHTMVLPVRDIDPAIVIASDVGLDPTFVSPHARWRPNQSLVCLRHNGPQRNQPVTRRWTTPVQLGHANQAPAFGAGPSLASLLRRQFQPHNQPSPATLRVVTRMLGRGRFGDLDHYEDRRAGDRFQYGIKRSRNTLLPALRLRPLGQSLETGGNAARVVRSHIS
jgi:hypothetical protein